MQLYNYIFISLLLMVSDDNVLVTGSNHSIYAYGGEDVILNCSLGSHIPPEKLEEVSWKKMGEDILILVFEKNETTQAHEQYRDRAEFFTGEILKGNFSLRLKSVKTEDIGVYLCSVTAEGFPAKTTVELQLGFSASHIMVLLFCITGIGFTVGLCPLIYLNSECTCTKAIFVLLSNLSLFLAFVFWGITEGSLYETIFCCALYILRLPMLTAFMDFSDSRFIRFCLLLEFIVFMGIYYSVLFKRALETVGHYGETDSTVILSMIGIVIMFLLFLILGILLNCVNLKNKSTQVKICKWVMDRLKNTGASIVFILPSLQLTLLLYIFGVARGVFFVAGLYPAFFILSFTCLKEKDKRDQSEQSEQKCYLKCDKIVWIIFMLVMNSVLVFFYIKTLAQEKDGDGLICLAVFLQVLWMISIYIKRVKDLVFNRNNHLALFGVGLVLLNSVALMTELILKINNGKGAIGDLRVTVFSSESVFAFSVLILLMFVPWKMLVTFRKQQKYITLDFVKGEFDFKQFHEKVIKRFSLRQDAKVTYKEAIEANETVDENNFSDLVKQGSLKLFLNDECSDSVLSPSETERQYAD